jgi:signal peptidase II
VLRRSSAKTLVGIAALVALCDQPTKVIVAAQLGPGGATQRVDLAGQWLALEYAENRGAAFGFMPQAGPLLVAVSIVVLGILLGHYFRTEQRLIWETIGVGAIVGGAAGNVIDRLRLGYVIDFIAIGAWPNFNVADSAITLGVALLLWAWLSGNPERRLVQSS